jgi:hypothetical protein
MAYIGNTASTRFVANRAASVYSGDGSTVAFTLEEAVGSDEDILVSVDGVIQEPSVGYAVSSGTTLTFSAAPSSNSGNNIFVYYLSLAKGSVVHPSNVGLTATTGAFSSNATVGGTLGITGVATGTIVKGTTSFQTPLIEFTDGDDAIAIADAGIITIKNTSSVITSEGGAATTIIAQGLAKAWTIFGNDAVVDDSFNIASATDVGTGRWRHVKTSVMANTTYSVVGSTGFEIANFVPGFAHTAVETTANHALSKYLHDISDYADMNASGTAKEIIVGDLA